MGAKLMVIAGPSEGKVFTLKQESETTIGRGENAQLMVKDQTVSRVHCVVEYFGERVFVRDNGSKTGTRVNGRPITEPYELKSDEVISVGTTKLKFERILDIEKQIEENRMGDIGMRIIPMAGEKRSEPPKDQVVFEDDDEDENQHEELLALKGTKLAHYQIHEVVGVGNSGVVFRAHDFKEDREVALKVYESEFAKKDEDLQRFIRAVKTMLPMRHSNLVTLYGGGKTGPYCWMAMEYVEGESLKDTIARIGRAGKIDWKPALRVAIDINCGLHYIHSENIIHRNLSPGNILFSRLGTVKLGSLILAKALSGALAKDVTVAGNFLGEVRFLAPEQVGAGGSVDARADIYSLGILVYAMLTGKTPFEGGTPMQTAQWIVQKEATPPRRVNPQIPEQVEKIVLKMISKKPEARYQTAADLIAELEQLPKIFT
jgi:serine/threonine protein kinase